MTRSPIRRPGSGGTDEKAAGSAGSTGPAGSAGPTRRPEPTGVAAPSGSTARATPADRVWAGAAIALPVLFVALWAVLGLIRDGYDPVRQPISELAERGAADGPWLTAGLVLFALAAVPLAGTAGRLLPGRGGGVGLAIVATGLGTLGVALFPCSPGCPGPAASTGDLGHTVSATVAYAGLAAAPLATAIRLARAGAAGRWRHFARWSAASSVVTAVVLAVWMVVLAGKAGGAAQRVANTMGDLWWASLGVALLRVGGPGRRDHGPVREP